MRTLFAIGLTLIACVASSAQGRDRIGVIRGVVLDAHDKPVAAAKVFAYPIGAIAGFVLPATTDDSGHFVTTQLPLGRFHVFVSKEEDYYPDESNLFYATQHHAIRGVITTLDKKHVQQEVTVRLGNRAAAITGTVADAETGEALRVCAELRRKDQPSIVWSGDGLLAPRFRVLVPADTPFSIVVWQQGYDPWFYQAQSGADSLRIRAGQELNLQIRLKANADKERPLSDKEVKAMRARQSRTGCAAARPQG